MVFARLTAAQQIDCVYRQCRRVGLGKAGGYAIQGVHAAAFARLISGSYYSGVVGLPLFETAQLLLIARQWLSHTLTEPPVFGPSSPRDAPGERRVAVGSARCRLARLRHPPARRARTGVGDVHPRPHAPPLPAMAWAQLRRSCRRCTAFLPDSELGAAVASDSGRPPSRWCGSPAPPRHGKGPAADRRLTPRMPAGAGPPQGPAGNAAPARWSSGLSGPYHPTDAAITPPGRCCRWKRRSTALGRSHGHSCRGAVALPASTPDAGADRYRPGWRQALSAAPGRPRPSGKWPPTARRFPCLACAR